MKRIDMDFLKFIRENLSNPRCPRSIFSFRKYLSFEFRFGTKVQQQADLNISCFEIVYQLGFMRFGNFFSSLQFKDDLVIYKYISEIFANCLVFIEDLDGNLLLDRMSAFCQFFCKSIFIHFLKKAIPKCIVDMIEGIDDVRCYLFMKHILPFWQ